MNENARWKSQNPIVPSTPSLLIMKQNSKRISYKWLSSSESGNLIAESKLSPILEVEMSNSLCSAVPSPQKNSGTSLTRVSKHRKFVRMVGNKDYFFSIEVNVKMVFHLMSQPGHLKPFPELLEWNLV